MRVALTGATGFVGCRTAEMLHSDPEHTVRLLTRGYGRLARIARYPLDVVPVSLDDGDGLTAALTGVEAAAHIAHDWGDAVANVAAVRAFTRAAGAARVRRVVYVSSLAVHDPFEDPTLGSATPLRPTSSAYALNKRECETVLATEAAKVGISAIILRPSCVYGPYSGSFTHVPMAEIRAARVALRGDGTCHLIYIDDLATAILSALSAPLDRGGAFLVSGPETTTWRGFYARFEQMASVQSVVEFASPLVEPAFDGFPLAMVSRSSRGLLHQERVKALARRAGRMLPACAWSAARRRVPRPLIFPDVDNARLRAATFVIDQAETTRAIGWTPKVGLEEGFANTGAYVRWARL